MWSHDYQDVKLEGKFKDLYITGIYENFEYFFQDYSEEYLKEIIKERDEFHLNKCPIYHRPFNDINTKEKLHSVAKVSKALLMDEEILHPHQWSDSAIYSVFESLVNAVSFEIFSVERKREKFKYRKLVNSTYLDIYKTPKIIEDKSKEVDAWYMLIESLADELLENRLFEHSRAKKILDAHPEKSIDLKIKNKIPSNYYTETVGYITEKELRDSVDYLMELVKDFMK
jgi:hypothetical protein